MTVVGNKNRNIVNPRVPINNWFGEYWQESTLFLSGLYFFPINNLHSEMSPFNCRLNNLKYKQTWPISFSQLIIKISDHRDRFE